MKHTFGKLSVMGIVVILIALAFTFQNCGGGLLAPTATQSSSGTGGGTGGSTGGGTGGSTGGGTGGLPEAPITVSVGSVQTCLIQSGKLSCLADNRWGMLGNGTVVNTSTPIDVVGLGSGVSAVATSWSHHMCAIHNGMIKCWGQNTGGNIGDGTNTNRYTPVVVQGLPTGATAISAGAFQNCANFSGNLKCWGSFHDGTDTTASAGVAPQDFGGLTTGVQDFDIGFWHSCAVVNGAAKCWGANNFGQLGDGTTTPRPMPVDVSGLVSGVSKITVGQYFSCAIHNGVPKCWGRGTSGEMGNGALTNQMTPVAVTGITDATQIAVTFNTGCALRSGGSVKCWGLSAGGTLGNGGAFGSVSSTPVDVVGLSANVTQLSGTGNHFCVMQANVPKCWGSNFKGKIGDGTLTDRNAPVSVLRTRDPATAPTATASIVSVTASTPGPIGINTPITWTVNTAPANTPIEYRYMIYNNTTATWVYDAVRFIDQNYITFNPDAPGTYHLQVWVRAKGKTVNYDNWENSAQFQAN
jgi:alpha-tubulin suppressor-like RCC1 family protein